VHQLAISPFSCLENGITIEPTEQEASCATLYSSRYLSSFILFTISYDISVAILSVTSCTPVCCWRLSTAYFPTSAPLKELLWKSRELSGTAVPPPCPSLLVLGLLSPCLCVNLQHELSLSSSLSCCSITSLSTSSLVALSWEDHLWPSLMPYTGTLMYVSCCCLQTPLPPVLPVSSVALYFLCIPACMRPAHLGSTVPLGGRRRRAGSSSQGGLRAQGFCLIQKDRRRWLLPLHYPTSAARSGAAALAFCVAAGLSLCGGIRAALAARRGAYLCVVTFSVPAQRRLCVSERGGASASPASDGELCWTTPEMDSPWRCAAGCGCWRINAHAAFPPSTLIFAVLSAPRRAACCFLPWYNAWHNALAAVLRRFSWRAVCWRSLLAYLFSLRISCSLPAPSAWTHHYKRQCAAVLLHGAAYELLLWIFHRASLAASASFSLHIFLQEEEKRTFSRRLSILLLPPIYILFVYVL